MNNKPIYSLISKHIVFSGYDKEKIYSIIKKISGGKLIPHDEKSLSKYITVMTEIRKDFYNVERTFEYYDIFNIDFDYINKLCLFELSFDKQCKKVEKMAKDLNKNSYSFYKIAYYLTCKELISQSSLHSSFEMPKKESENARKLYNEIFEKWIKEE